MAELNFRSASVDEVASAYFSSGCVLLRDCVDGAKLAELKTVVDQILDETKQIHLYDKEMTAAGRPHFSEYLFDDKHYSVLKALLGRGFKISGDTATRRIDPAPTESGWQPPLDPHLDVFFHHFAFTVNFWVPFQDCGATAPSLGVVRASFAEAKAFAGYDGKPQHNGAPSVWNYPNFAKAPIRLDELRTAFDERIWTPEYRFGDAMMLSNWTLHFTHSAPGMVNRRQNVELRFFSRASLEKVSARHRRREARQKLARMMGWRRGDR